MSNSNSTISKNFKTFMETSYVHLYQDLNTRICYGIWKDWANEADYKKTIDNQLLMMVSTGSAYMLCDIRNFKGTSPAAQKYTTDEVMPKLYNNAKLEKIAYIVGESIFANFTLTVIRKAIDDESYLITNAFKSVEEGEKWLKEKV